MRESEGEGKRGARLLPDWARREAPGACCWCFEPMGDADPARRSWRGMFHTSCQAELHQIVKEWERDMGLRRPRRRGRRATG